jgi:hypothetical protein
MILWSIAFDIEDRSALKEVRSELYCRSVSGSFLYLAFKIVAVAGTFASRLDATRIRHSGGHAQAREHPTHQHDVYCEERNEPQPVGHKHFFLISNQ